jgi:hypothetical protein
MMLKTLSNYLRYSGIWVGLVVNPFHWDFRIQTLHPDDLNPNMRGVYVSIGPIWTRLVIDNGSW